MEEDPDDQVFNKLWEDLDLAFPNCPFFISCVNSMQKLDEKFTDEQLIIIKDDRAKYWSLWFEDFTEEEANEYINYTVVKASYSQPITLRTIIQAMTDDGHYSNFYTLRDSHRFLEGFDKSSELDILYTCSFGS